MANGSTPMEVEHISDDVISFVDVFKHCFWSTPFRGQRRVDSRRVRLCFFLLAIYPIPNVGMKFHTVSLRRSLTGSVVILPRLEQRH